MPLVALVLLASGIEPSRAEDLDLQSRANLQPSMARLGDPVLYRGRVVLPRELSAKWLPPQAGDDFTWGELFPKRIPGPAPAAGEVARDTLTVEATFQAFRTGVLPVLGPRFQVDSPTGPRMFHLPTVNLVVTSVLAAGDSTADLRPVRGPIAAPWWERVPWLWLAIGVVAIALATFGWRRWRRRKPGMVPASLPSMDPAAEALAELAALRGRNLPAHGRFGEHAFHLTRIVRRFLEVATRAPHPGDTTRELLMHLETTGIAPDELQMLGGLLRLWDGVKFAQAPSTTAEAQRAEQAVELMIRRHAPQAAAAATVPSEKKVA